MTSLISALFRTFQQEETNAKSAIHKKLRRRNRGRICRVEELEARELLDVSAAEFLQIRDQYTDLNLGDFADYNIVDIADISDTNLRNAINDANGTEHYLIVVRTTATQNTITLGGSEFVVGGNSGSVTIVSFGDAEYLTLDAGGNSRVFSSSGNNVALAGLLITNGEAENGGGVYNNGGTLTIVDCMFTENSATKDGAGLYNDTAGTVTITGSTVTKNSSAFWGAGLYNRGTMTVIDSSVTDNTTGDNGSAGGIYNGNTLTVMGCIIAGNSATGTIGNSGNGGGVFTNPGTTTHLVNSLIVGNSTVKNGGGVFNMGTTVITNCTIVGNSATEEGSGIFISNEGNVTLNNTIVAENSKDIRQNNGTLTGNNSLVGNGGGQTAIVDGTNGNIVGVRPLFANLSGTNWQTWDLHLRTGSPAIGAGSVAFAADADGNPLQFDLDGKARTTNGRVNMGAYETGGTLQPPANQLAAPTGVTADSTSLTSVTVSWNPVTNASGYIVQYSTDADFAVFNEYPVIGNTTRTVNIPYLMYGVKYYFRVVAAGSGNYINSLPSASVEATPGHLSAPTGLTAVGTGGVFNIINVTWNRVLNAGGYRVQYATNASFTSGVSTITVNSGSTTSCEFVGTGNATYYVRVMAIGAGQFHDSGYSAPVTAATLTAPAYFMSIAQTTNSITLIWDPPSGQTEYVLKYKRSTDSIWQTWRGLNTEAGIATITGLTADTSYIFSLQTAGGAWEAATTVAATKSTIPSQLSVPTGVTASSKNTTTLTVKWNAVSNAAYYVVYYSTDANFTQDVKQWTAVGGASVDIAGLKSGVKYYIRVIACGYDASYTNSSLSATAEAIPGITLNQPSNFRSTAQSSDSVTLAWATQGNLTGYKLEYKKSADTQWTTVKSAPGTNTASATITKLKAETTYEFRLTAIKGNDSLSSTITLTTHKVIPAPVKASGIKKSNISFTTATITWKNNARNVEYIVAVNAKTPLPPGARMVTLTDADGKNTGVRIDGLAAGTTYKFTVTTKNEQGKEARPALITVKTVKYPSVSKLKVTEKFDNSVSLTWTAPKKTDVALTGYEVVVMLNGATVTTLTATGTSIRISDLLPSTKYTFIVTALGNENGTVAKSLGAKVSANTLKKPK